MILRSAGIKFYRDVDLYMFFILLLNNQLIKNYCITYKLDTTITARPLEGRTTKRNDKLEW